MIKAKIIVKLVKVIVIKIVKIKNLNNKIKLNRRNFL